MIWVSQKLSEMCCFEGVHLGQTYFTARQMFRAGNGMQDESYSVYNKT
jgi:hypothetical protein